MPTVYYNSQETSVFRGTCNLCAVAAAEEIVSTLSWMKYRSKCVLRITVKRRAFSGNVCSLCVVAAERELMNTDLGDIRTSFGWT